MKKNPVLLPCIALFIISLLGCTDTEDTTAPGEVSDIRIIKYADRSVVTWTDPADADLTGIMISSSSAAIADEEVDSGVESVELAGLVKGNEYEITIQTEDSSGNVSEGVTIAIRFHLYEFVRCIELNGGIVQDIQPSGIAVDSVGNIFVANHGGQVSGNPVESIVKYSSAGTLVGSWEVQDAAADPPWDDIEGLCIATDPGTGNEYVFIANCTAGSIDRYGTGLSTYAGSRVGTGGGPIALWGDGNGNVYSITEDTGVQHIDAGDMSLHSVGTIPGAWEIALDSSGEIYIPDTANDEIDVYDSQGSYVRNVTGLGFDLTFPGFTVGPDDCLIIANDVSDKILVYDRSGDKVLEWGETGVLADGTRFDGPYRMTFDDQGLLYIVDARNDRVLVFNP